MSLKTAENTYDELGQLATKGVGGKTSQNRLQEIDYAYNVRGWLKNINDVGSSNATITLGSGDLFGFELNYNAPSSGTALYNGNISQTLWKSTSANPSGNTISNRYDYAYDALNRITSAIDNTGRYNTHGITYDKNGNILTLKREGAIVNIPTTASHFNEMDNLSYFYDSGNKLTKVADSGNHTYGFKDGANSTTEYTYDANGNMKTDANKNIGSITYNHLNLPTSVGVDWNSVTYVYDATGVKLSKTVHSYPSTTTTQYAGNYIYENNTLQFFNHPEGYVQHKNGIFSYVYQYKDHLGNVRLSYADVSTTNTPVLEIIEESNYYPFGLKHKGYNNVTSSNGNSTAQKFKYNGIELEESLGLNLYEMDVRSYDPALARFTGIDPVTHHSMSTYTAFDNNPVYWADPSGADAVAEFNFGGYNDFDSKGASSFNEPYKNKDFANLTGAITTKAGAKSGDPDDPTYSGSGVAIGNVTNLLPEITITAKGGGGAVTPLYSTEVERYSYGGTLAQYKEQYGVSGSYSEIRANWEKNHSAEFYAWTAQMDQNQKDQENLGKLKFFTGAYGTIGQVVSPGSKVASYRSFNIRGFGTGGNNSTTTLTNYWPGNGGALGKWETQYLMPGTKIDRFGSGFGKYFSPANTPMDMRALPTGNTGTYNLYNVLKPFPVQSSTIAPAFGKLGLGTQYLSPVRANILLKRGIIAPIK